MDNIKDRLKDLWDFSSIQLTTIAGTGNAITAACDPALTAGVTTGMKFSFVAANTNTAGVTIAINGASAINVRDDSGNALISGAIVAGRLYTLEFDGTNLRALGTSGIVKINNYQSFTANGTWNKPAGTPSDALVTIHVWAGGGGGGVQPSQNAAGGGGGGGFVSRTMRAGDISSSVTITIGAGGAPGSAGGISSFGALVVAFGGGTAGNPGLGSSRASCGGGGGGASRVGGNGGTTTGSGGLPGDATAGIGGDSTAGTGPAVVGGLGYFGGSGGGGSFRTSGGAGTGADGGPSVWGGGGGGGNNGNSGTAGIGGVSLYGGNGGASQVAGTAPGGGGGGSASGARGEIHVFVNG